MYCYVCIHMYIHINSGSAPPARALERHTAPQCRYIAEVARAGFGRGLPADPDKARNNDNNDDDNDNNTNNDTINNDTASYMVICIYTYTYIYIERERERDRNTKVPALGEYCRDDCVSIMRMADVQAINNNDDSNSNSKSNSSSVIVIVMIVIIIRPSKAWCCVREAVSKKTQQLHFHVGLIAYLDINGSPSRCSKPHSCRDASRVQSTSAATTTTTTTTKAATTTTTTTTFGAA